MANKQYILPISSTPGSAGGGSGTVTSVTFTGDGTILSNTPSAAVTTSGTLSATAATQSGNVVVASPANGSSGALSARSLVAADLPGLPTSGQGFFWSVYGFSFPAPAVNVFTNASNNQIHVVNMILPYSITIRNVTVRTGSTASAGGKFGCSIYNAAGTTLLIDSGVFSNTNASTVLTNAITAVVLPPGNYWFGWAQDNTTGTVSAFPTDASFEAMFVNDGIKRMGNAANAWSNSTGFPSSLGAITAAANNTLAACFTT